MANASLPTRTDGSFGQTKSNPTSPTDLSTQASAVEWNAIADALIQLIGQTWQTVSSNGTTVVAGTTDVANVTATGAVTLTPPTTYAGRRVMVVKAAAAVGGITWTGYGTLPGSGTSSELVYELHYDGSAWRLVRGSANATIARLTAKRTISGTTGTLAVTDKIAAINASGNFTLTLPPAASASGLDFLLQRIDIASAYTLTLALDAGDTGSKIYFQGNTPSAGASLTVTGADSQTRPGFLLWSDGTDWYLA